MFKQVIAVSAFAASALAAFSNVTVTDITVTDYVTYCPEPTTITITKCEEVCKKTEIVVTEPQTVTVTGTCIVPSSVVPEVTTKAPVKPTTVAPEVTTKAPEPTKAPVVSSFEGAGVKNAAGALAGVAAVAAALL